MAMRWGLGPVFAYEWLIASRRWQPYALRSLFVAILLAGLAVGWYAEVRDQPLSTIQAQAQAGQKFTQTLVIIQLALVLLAAPAATAGAICVDKARGTLAHVLTTDLSDAEIVLGKLAVRLVPVLGLIACSLTTMVISTLLGGVDPARITGAILVTVGVAVLGCSLALTLSVWGRKTHEVLLMTYLLLMAWLLAAPIWSAIQGSLGGGWTPPAWLVRSNPFAVALGSPVQPVSVTAGQQAGFLGAAAMLSAVLIGLATLSIRSVVVRQAGRGARPRKSLLDPLARATAKLWRLLPHPTLEGNPVLWREWHRIRPSGWTLSVWCVYVGAALLFSGLGVAAALSNDRPAMEGPGAVSNGMQVVVGLLLLSVSSATSLAEERQRGSLEVLMSTPLPTPAIVWGKWWGAFRRVPLLAILPGIVAASFAIHSGRWVGPPVVVGLVLVYGAALTSLGLALATWVSRLGRAVGLTVAVYVLGTVGAIPMGRIFFRQQQHWAGFASASPFWGTGYFSAMIAGMGGPAEQWPVQVTWSLFWIIAYGAAVAGLLAATLATFNRCVGRMDNTEASRLMAKPAAKPSWPDERDLAVEPGGEAEAEPPATPASSPH